MPVLNVKKLHNDTSAVISEVAKGKSFEVEKHGKVVATIRPAKSSSPATWSEILAPVRALHGKVKKTANPVLAERARRRR